MTEDERAAAVVSTFVELVRLNPTLPADDPAFRRGFAALLVAVLADSS
jgi:hypothetical protein